MKPTYFLNSILKYFRIPVILGLFLLNCKSNNPNNIYAAISNNNIGWQEIEEQLANGSTKSGNLRKYFFRSSGDFEVICEASDASCLVGNNNVGTWNYITGTKVQVMITSGPIYFYDVVKIDAYNLWLQDNNTKNTQILRKLVPSK